MAFLLPAVPVDVFKDSVLVKKKATDRFQYITKDLPEGSHTYRVTVIDSGDFSRGRDFDVMGVSAGKIIAVDLRSLD